MKKFFLYTLVTLVTVMSIVVSTGKETAVVSATLAVESLEDGEYAIDNTYQFLNPYDNTTKVDGNVASEMAITAGKNIMNKVMNPDVTFEKEGAKIYVNLTLATQIDLSGYNVENLEIFVEDAAGSNTYTKVDYTVGTSKTIDGQVYDMYRFEVASLDLVISPRYTVMSPSGFFITLGDTGITPVVTKSALASKLTEAQAISSTGLTADSYAALQAAIRSAQAVYNDDTATQEDVNAQVRALTSAIAALVGVKEGLEDGVYEVPVALWHATEDRASMVAASLNNTARIVVKDGVETMYIYTQAGTMGYIPGFQIATQARSAYVSAQVMSSDAAGNPTSFAFALEHHNPYLAVKVITTAGTDQGMAARLKFDYAQLTAVDANIDILQAPASATNNAGVATADTSNASRLAFLGMSALAVVFVLMRKKRLFANEIQK